MEIESESHHTDENGFPMDEFELAKSPYDRAVLQRLRDDKMVLTVYQDGEKEAFPVEKVPLRFQGVEFEQDRRRLPNDVQDIFLHLGFTVMPDSMDASSY